MNLRWTTVFNQQHCTIPTTQVLQHQHEYLKIHDSTAPIKTRLHTHAHNNNNSKRKQWRNVTVLTCITCAAKPPMAPSSTEIIAGCSFAKRRSNSASNGLQKRASTTVAETPTCMIKKSSRTYHWKIKKLQNIIPIDGNSLSLSLSLSLSHTHTHTHTNYIPKTVLRNRFLCFWKNAYYILLWKTKNWKAKMDTCNRYSDHINRESVSVHCKQQKEKTYDGHRRLFDPPTPPNDRIRSWTTQPLKCIRYPTLQCIIYCILRSRELPQLPDIPPPNDRILRWPHLFHFVSRRLCRPAQSSCVPKDVEGHTESPLWAYAIWRIRYHSTSTCIRHDVPPWECL